VSYIMVRMDNNFAGYFLPQEIASRTDWSNKQASFTKESFPITSSYIMVNNIMVSVKAFTYGIAAGIGTFYIVLTNGAMLGALTALVANHTTNLLYYWALILPHGVIELTAIFISGGVGLSLGKSILIPGEYSRVNSLIQAAKKSAAFIPGIVLMLILAGLIEGFFTPLPILPEYKLGFALLTLILLSGYFSLPYWKK
jgi:uncharacterized membrane protein SpoIIM required for sporulation